MRGGFLLGTSWFWLEMQQGPISCGDVNVQCESSGFFLGLRRAVLG